MQNEDEEGEVGYILIYKIPHRDNSFDIASNSPFFHVEHLLVDVKEGVITFKVPDIDNLKKVHRPFTNKKSPEWRSWGASSEFLKTGRFEFDEEDSTEDEVVIYL